MPVNSIVQQANQKITKVFEYRDNWKTHLAKSPVLSMICLKFRAVQTMPMWFGWDRKYMFTKLNTFYKLGSCCNMRYHYFTLSMLRARWCSANIRIPNLDVKVRLRKAFIVSYCKQANKIVFIGKKKSWEKEHTDKKN